MDIEKKIEFISEAYRTNQSMISFADTKANISLSVQSLLISIGLSTSILSNAFEHVQKLNNNLSYVFYFIVVVLIISSIIGIILSMHVCKARPPIEEAEQKRKGLLYFEHIIKFPTSTNYFDEINNIDENGILREFTQQVYNLSHIVKEKMKYVNLSINFLMFNLFITIILMILIGYIIK